MHARRSVGSFVVASTAIALVAIGCGSAPDVGAFGERSETPGACNPSPPERMSQGRTFTLRHFSFDAPAVWHARGTWWDDGETLDPSRPQRRADIDVGIGESDRIDAASVEVSEDAIEGTPAAAVATWKAAFDASHAPGCNATFDVIVFRCEPAALRTIQCAEGPGLLTSYSTTLEVFHAGATFTLACDIAGQSDAAATCGAVSRSFVVDTTSSVSPLVLHTGKQFSFSTPSGWIDDGSAPGFLKWKSDTAPDADVAAAFVTSRASLDEDVDAWRTYVRTEHADEGCTVDVASTMLGSDFARRVHAHCATSHFDLVTTAALHQGRVFDVSCVSRRDDGACASVVSTFRFPD